MKILWVFLAAVVVRNSQANFCRVCIDNSVFVSDDQTISYLVEAVVDVAQDEITNCTTTTYINCEGACISVDYYSDNETDAYMGSLRYCDMGEQYNVNNASYYLVCTLDNCNAAVPISKLVYFAADLAVLTMALLGSLTALLIILILYKAVGCPHRRREEDVFDGIGMFPETPVHIQMDELDSVLNYGEDNENESTLI